MNNPAAAKNHPLDSVNAQEGSVKPPVGQVESVKPPVGNMTSVKPPQDDSELSVKPPVGQ